MRSKFHTLSLALAVTAVATLVACGGGGGGGGGSPATATMTVTPSLGQFSNGTPVELWSGGAFVASAPVLAGSAAIVYNTSAINGPVVVRVLGGTNYFDEGTGTNVPFPAASAMLAVMSTPLVQVGVTPLSNAVAANMVSTNASGAVVVNPSTVASAIDNANYRIAQIFNLSNALQVPTLVSSAAQAPLDLGKGADQYALVLASLANAAKAANTNAAGSLADLSTNFTPNYLATPASAAAAAATSVVVKKLSTVQAAVIATYAPGVANAASQLTLNTSGAGTTPPVQSDITLAKNLFANLRTTFHAISNGNATGTMDLQVQHTASDLQSNVMPNMDRLSDRMNLLGNAMAFLDRTYTAPVAAVPANFASAVTYAGSVPQTTYGSLYNVAYGYGGFAICFGDPTNANAATCVGTNSSSVDWSNSKLKFLAIQMTRTPGSTQNTYSYTATRYNAGFTTPSNSVVVGLLSLAKNAYYSTPTAALLLPTGTGTVTETLANGKPTGVTYVGTMPPSTSLCISTTASGVTTPISGGSCNSGTSEVPATGGDTINITASKASAPQAAYPSNTASSINRYAVSGSVVSNAVDYSKASYTVASNKQSTFRLNSGSYFDQDETNSNSFYPLAASLSLTAQTLATQFNGTLSVGSFAYDKSTTANWSPTTATFTGSYVDISSGSPATVASGSLNMSTSNWSKYDSTLGGNTPGNFLSAVVTFNGTLQPPQSPVITLVVQLSSNTSNAFGTSTVTGSFNYSGANGAVRFTATGTSTTDPSTLITSNSVTLTDSISGLQYAPDATVNGQVDITKGTSSVILAKMLNGYINYSDGTSESAN